METNDANNNAAQAAETPNPLERRIDLFVLSADIEKGVSEELKRIGKTLKMPGFRPGKVPPAIVRQQYGAEAQQEALGKALQQAFEQAVNTQKLRVAGPPHIEPKASEDPLQIAFLAIFEVYPEFTPSNAADVRIERPVLEVGDTELNSAIDVLRKQRVRYDAVERAAQQDDLVVVDFLGKKDGVPFEGGQGTDQSFVIGAGRMLPDFETAAVGMSADDSKTFELTFPNDYAAKDLAGQTVSFELTLKKVSAPVLPEVDSDFALSLGIADGSLETMRNELGTNLKREVKKRLASKVKDQVMDALIQANPIDVPRALILEESKALMAAAREDLIQRMGERAKTFPLEPAWFKDRALRRVHLGLVLSEIVKANSLYVKAEQIKAHVEELAQSYERPEEVVRWYYAQPERLADIEGAVLEDNVVNWVLSSAQVVDTPTTFDALMGQAAAHTA